MMNSYLIASDDDSVSHWEPVVVSAASQDDAIDRYLRLEYSKDPIFRESVLDLAINCSFLEQFFIFSPADKQSFDTTGKVDYDLEVVKGRVMAFFSKRPELGERFIRYMDTQDPEHVSAEVFEYISAADRTGIVALDIAEIRKL
jgi:hypothetical protein